MGPRVFAYNVKIYFVYIPYVYYEYIEKEEKKGSRW